VALAVLWCLFLVAVRPDSDETTYWFPRTCSFLLEGGGCGICQRSVAVQMRSIFPGLEYDPKAERDALDQAVQKKGPGFCGM